VLELVTRQLQSTSHATNPIEPAMQIDHLRTSGDLMQPIDVLRQQQLASTSCLESREGMMGIVGQGPAEPPPSDQASRPITLPRLLVAHEGLIGDRLHSLPVALAVAIVRDAGMGAAACPRQHEKALVPGNEILKRAVFHHAPI
jgi:hypothetical protein